MPKTNIYKIEPIEIEIPYLHPYISAWSGGAKQTKRIYTLIKLITEDGITGWGSCGGSVAGLINKSVKPYLEGHDLLQTEQYAKVLRCAGNVWGAEIAIWDAIGKTAGMPLYKMWGGYKDKIKAYISTAQVASPEQRAKDAAAFAEQGFKAIKLRAHYESIKEDIAIVERVRQAVGDKMEIMVDANQSFDRIGHDTVWDYHRAKKTAEEYDKLGVIWLEEPLPKEDIDGLRRLCDEVDIKIAGGEGEVGIYRLAQLVNWDVYDILQPDALHSESLSQLKKIATACELKNKWFAPHHGKGGIGTAAHIQLCCAIPNAPYLEYMFDPPSRTIEDFMAMGGIVLNPPMIDDEGYVHVPSLPGIGVQIDEEIINKYAVAE